MHQAFLGFVVPDIQNEFGATLEDIGWILTASFLFAALCVVGIGMVADRFGRRIVLVRQWAFSVAVVPSLLVGGCAVA